MLILVVVYSRRAWVRVVINFAVVLLVFVGEEGTPILLRRRIFVSCCRG
jgi:hypothetical protein